MNPSLLVTKLHRPAAPAGHVRRPHLIRRLNEGLVSGRQLILVSAPAGFGKTTCVGEWLDGLEGWPVAWLSLDAADDDPRRFFAYLFAALQGVDPALGREIEGALRSGQLPPTDVISATLINDVVQARGAEGRFLLVLDDLHVLQDPTILQVLEDLVTNLPPAMYLALLSREDPPLPLARPRAHGRLTEIRATDLRFRRPEAGQFLNQGLNLSLSAPEVALLEERTEGWIAGLQLAGLSLRDRADRSAFLATLSGSHRFILSYLTEEVLSRQPEETRRFLLETSILDRLNGDLCDAVTGCSNGRQMLKRLLNANLFLVPLDDQGRWYRYHHLFADLLRDLQGTLGEEDLADLHRRASRWYAAAGEGQEAFSGEAIHHALAAREYDLAIDLMERHAAGLIAQGYAKTVNGWLEAIPPGWTTSSPRTSLAFAWMHLLRGSYAEATPHLEQARAAFENISTEPQMREEASSLETEWLVMQCLLLIRQGDAMAGHARARRALEMASEHDSRLLGLAYFGLAFAHEVLGEYDAAVDAYQRAIQHSRVAENLIIEMMSTASLARLAFEHGQLHLAFEIAAPVSTRLDQDGAAPPIATMILGILGEICYHWYRIDEARRYARRALQLSALGGYNSGLIGLWTLLSRLSQLDRDVKDAARETQHAVDLMRVDTPDYVQQEAISQQVRVYLARNRPAAAQLALRGQGFSFRDRFAFPSLPPAQSLTHSMGLLYNSSLHLLLHQAQRADDLADIGPGLELADGVIAGALQGGRLLVALEALLLRARMRALLAGQQSGSTEERAAYEAASQDDYVHALELGEPEGIVGAFLEHGRPLAKVLADLVRQNRLGSVAPDYVERILAAFSDTQAPATPAGQTLEKRPAGAAPPTESAPPFETALLIEPLTDREQEVLGLMARGLKYREIAAELFISLNTVRSHVKAIYGKLLVNNRTRAVTKARRLGML